MRRSSPFKNSEPPRVMMNDGGPNTTIAPWAIWKAAANNSPIAIAIAVFSPILLNHRPQ